MMGLRELQSLEVASGMQDLSPSRESWIRISPLTAIHFVPEISISFHLIDGFSKHV